MNTSKKIATCYCPAPKPGQGQESRLIEINLDETTGTYTASKVHNGTAESSVVRKTESAALEWASELGFTEVVRAS